MWWPDKRYRHLVWPPILLTTIALTVALIFVLMVVQHWLSIKWLEPLAGSLQWL